MDVIAACHRVTATGLFKSINYSYDAYSNRASVVLNLNVVDEMPLVHCSIKPEADEAALWPALQANNPIFSREIPPTEKALASYEKSITDWLYKNGRADHYAAPLTVGTSGSSPSTVIFEIRSYKASPTSRSK